MRHIIVFLFFFTIFLIFSFEKYIKLSSINLELFMPYISGFALFLISLSNAYRIMPIFGNIKAKFQGTKKIEAQICKNDQIDAIQNLTISNIENRLTIIEEKLKNANM